MTGDCPQCGQTIRIGVGSESCPHCGQSIQFGEAEAAYRSCAFCGNTRFYVQKDFNRTIGCLVMLAGAALVPFTYGLSLVVFALIDYLLYRRVADMAVCYVCDAEVRGIAVAQTVLPFRHHMAEGYQERKDTWNARITALRDGSETPEEPGQENPDSVDPRDQS